MQEAACDIDIFEARYDMPCRQSDNTVVTRRPKPEGHAREISLVAPHDTGAHIFQYRNHGFHGD